MTEIRHLEELSLNAWPSLQTLLYDGWIVRFANGYTKRANSINPLYPSSLDVTAKIQTCEQFYRSRDLPVVFKMTHRVFPDDLDALLEKRGYKSSATTSVQLLNLETVEHRGTFSEVTTLFEDWLVDYCRLNAVDPRHHSTLRQMLSNAGSSTGFFCIKSGAETIACGMGVAQDQFIGLFDIVTQADYRNRGYGRQLVSDILVWGKAQGAHTAYLQVVLNNAPALRLYSGIGFVEAYRYWYRIST